MSRKIAFAKGKLILKGLCLISVLACLGVWVLTQIKQAKAEEQQTSEVLVTQADTRFKAKQFKQALQSYEQAVQSSPTGSEQAFKARKGLIQAQVATGRIDQARSAAAEFLKDYKAQEDRYPQAACEIGEALDLFGQSGQARECFKKVLIEPGDGQYLVWAYRGAAMASIAMGELDEAAQNLQALKESCKGKAGQVAALEQVAACYSSFECHDKAIELCKDLLISYWNQPEAIQIQSDLAEALTANGNLTEAQEAIDQLVRNYPRDPQLPKYLMRLSRKALVKGRYDLAIQTFERLAKGYSDSEEARDLEVWQAKARALAAMKAGQDLAYEGALVDLRTMGDKTIVITALEEVGALAQKAGKEASARSLYEEAIRRGATKSDLESRRCVGLAHIGLGQVAQAKEVLDGLIRDYADDPDLARSLVEIAGVYEQRLGTPTGISGVKSEPQALRALLASHLKTPVSSEEAGGFIAVLDKLGELSQDRQYTPQGLHILAQCCHRMGNRTKALEVYERLDGDWPAEKYRWHAQLMVAKGYERMAAEGKLSGQQAHEKALAAYTQVLERYPNSPAAKVARKWLEQSAN